MDVRYSVKGKGNVFELNVKYIPIGKLTKCRNGYKLILEEDKLKLYVFIPLTKFKFTKAGRISASRFSLKVQKNKSYYNLRIKFNTNVVLKNIKNNLFKIKYLSKKGITARGMLTVTKEEIEEQSKQLKQREIKTMTKRIKNAEIKKIEEEAKKQRIKRLVEKLELLEAKFGGNHKVDNDKTKSIDVKKLASKGIYLKDPFIERRCDNCVYLVGNKCVYHNVKVAENFGCYKFRKHRIISGGGFSPR